MAEAGPAGLDGWLIVPRTKTKPPLVLLSDGKHFGNKIHEIGPGALLPEALWFVRRGWAVAIVSRRGMGLSGGEDSNAKMPKMPCSEATFEWVQETNAQDLRAAYTFLTAQPDIDTTRTVAAGYFFAGSAAMWLANGGDGPLPGLKAVINLDGGWVTEPDWLLKGKVHAIPDAIIPSFAKLGASTKTPMLWLYSKHGGEFGLKSANAAFDAFTSSGGAAEMHVLPHQENGAQFLFEENASEWGPLVEKFLTRLNLPSAELIPPAPNPDLSKLPKDLSPAAKQAYLDYLQKGPNKAFAYSSEEHAWGYSDGLVTLQKAKDKAISNCPVSNCKVIAFEH
jgi:dienelactone hydrolase